MKAGQVSDIVERLFENRHCIWELTLYLISSQWAIFHPQLWLIFKSLRKLYSIKNLKENREFILWEFHLIDKEWSPTQSKQLAEYYANSQELGMLHTFLT